MLIKKGPFGYFAVERFDSPESIFSYAGEVIDKNRSGCLLPCSIDVNGITSSAYFDFSGLMSVRQSGSLILHGSHHSKKLAKLLDDRRKSAGDFFCSVLTFLNNLISPSAIVLDPEYVFTDETGSCIKFCLIPCKSSPDTIRLSSLGSERLELLLSERFFDGVLTNDEKQEIIYSVKTDNELLFSECAQRLCDTRFDSGSTDKKPEAGKPGAPKHLPERKKENKRTAVSSNRSLSKPSELLWSLAGSLASIAALKLSGLLPSILFILVSGVFLIKFFMNRRTKKDIDKNEIDSISKVRRMILFSDGDDNDNYETGIDITEKETEHSHSVTPLFTGTLTYLSEKNGKTKSYSIMMDRTTIGSDVFLSDIVIDDPSVDALHAVIYLTGKTFYISDCSRKGTTYIDDRKVAVGRKCEIKNGQKITIGTVDFRFRVLLPSAGQVWTSESEFHNAL